MHLIEGQIHTYQLLIGIEIRVVVARNIMVNHRRERGVVGRRASGYEQDDPKGKYGYFRKAQV